MSILRCLGTNCQNSHLLVSEDNTRKWPGQSLRTPSAITGFDSKLTGVGLVPGEDTLLDVGESDVKFVVHCCCTAACAATWDCCGACGCVDSTGWN